MGLAQKKVVIISPSNGLGGAEKWCLSIAEVVADKFIVSLVPFVIASESCLELDFPVVLWHGWSRRTSQNLIKLKDILHDFELVLNAGSPSIVLCATWPAALLCLYLKARGRLEAKLMIVFHRQVEEVLFRSSWFNLLVPLKFLFFRHYLRLADRIVVLNEASRVVLVKWMHLQPVVIANGVDCGQIRALASEGDNKTGSLQYVIYLGRLEKEKGVEPLIRAFAQLQDVDVDLMLVGSGSLDCEMRHLAEKLDLEGRVSFMGFLENPFPLLRGAAALVIASPWECQPLAVLEAFALGVPVVAVDNPGVRSLIGENQRGVLCAGTEYALASALKEVLAGGAIVQKRVEIAMSYAEEHNSSRSLNQYVNILEELSL